MLEDAWLLPTSLVCVSYAPFSFHFIFSVRFCLVSDKFIAQHSPSLMKSIRITKSRHTDRPNERLAHTRDARVLALPLTNNDSFASSIWCCFCGGRRFAWILYCPWNHWLTDAYTLSFSLSLSLSRRPEHGKCKKHWSQPEIYAISFVCCVRASHGNRASNH